ncbi:EpsG family protein [Sabulilitoribacter arenilitoris]|uniref:EpsG family protein n=1 Tax=Wocania arenilitoris TaxID=2044858 RepID=A0AAE3EPH9_9FLAO|nr:EpsG family protein [Wocania arenilitoris]MCF7568647.1 EpsG family protein [Wocania arenilitoris]
MIDFFPLEHYYDVYIHFCLFLVVANLLHAYSVSLNDEKNIKFLRTSGYVLLILITLYLGLRPISGRFFGDMGTYSRYFMGYANGLPVTTEKDALFHFYMKTLSYVVGKHTFFLITAALYIFPHYIISKKHFKPYWFYAFLMFVVSLSFYTYGTNGIRNGVATALFLWGLCYPKKKIIMGVLFLIAVLCHKSLLLPVMAYVLTLVYNKPKTYLIGWLSAIPISLVLGSVFITIFTSLGFGDDRLAGYLSGEYTETEIKTGFRWDFLFYSAFPVFAGWYYIFKKNFQDKFYSQLFNTYLICNGFWILVIRANFSNRFAYLSWFLMAIIIIYPPLKQLMFKNQQIMIAKIVVTYFLFTYLMYFVYYN